ncbi:uncharacterized protein ACO6RY_11024 [Pungitius sinensis]
MSKASAVSKAVAGTFVLLTVSALAGIFTMVIFYKIEISEMNVTSPPTMPPTTTRLPPVLRLPRDLIPQSYEVFLQPDFYTKIIEVVNVTSPNQTMLFTGNSTVSFHCVQGTKAIYLHSSDLIISDPVVMNKNKREKVVVSSVKSHSYPSNFLEIQLEEALEEGVNYSLFLAFQGDINLSPYAMFISTYVEGSPVYEGDQDTERFLVATTLEPTYARKVFPCFDEPDMKAVFHVTIIHRTDTQALGNAEVRESNVIDVNWKVTYFHPTPKMSTYLFAFTVLEFTFTEPSTPGRVDIKTYARPDAIRAGHAQYATDIAEKILKFYEKYFGINYQQKKLTQIALPDLRAPAMENWGLVTYQEGRLLYEEGVSSLLHKEDIASIIAHELAHQWFGNLVTMKWWNDIWLNEGFATYFSILALDCVEPSFQLKEWHIMSNLHTAFEHDALASSHPLSPLPEDIQGTFEIEGMFDSITYFKGAALLRMLADIVSETTFTKGIKMYLSDFKFNNTDQDDLWKYIQKAVYEDNGHTDVAKVMNAWTKQIGYPVITINTTNGEIYQKHFQFNDSSESNLWWEVPIRVMSNAPKSSPIWLTSSNNSKEEFISRKGEWILANVNCTGYYRVNYNSENWERLLTQLQTNPGKIPLMNRGQLVDDAFNLARAKLVEVALALNSTCFLQDETEFLPWKLAVRNLEYFVLMFDRSEVNGPMQAYLRQQVKGLYNFFRNYTDNSTVPEDHSLQHNQILAIEVACSNGLPECLEMATNMFAVWMDSNGTNQIHPNLRSVIYCQALAAGGKEEWDFAWDKFQSASDTSEKEQLRQALSCTKKIWLLNRYLEYTLNPEKIRRMDVGPTIRDIAQNVAGQALAWNFIRAHWAYVQWDSIMLVKAVTRRFSTPFELAELERFGAEYPLGSATMAVQQAIEQTQVNIQWVSENKDSVLEWFENFVERV